MQQEIKDTPLASFIVPYYNLPVPMLCECLDSILALPLSQQEREVIVVDDGSDRSPLDELPTATASAIRYLHQPNGGLSLARNTGLEAATGQYIQFVDADDRLLPHAYAHCLDLVRRDRPDMVLFNLTHGTPSDDRNDVLPAMSGTELMLRHNIHGTACGYLFRRDILGQLRFTPRILHEDEEFTPRLLLQAATVRVCLFPAYHYRQRPYSITTATSIRQRLRRLSNAHTVIGSLNSLAATLTGQASQALMRRVHQLTMDYVYNVIRLTRSRRHLDRHLSRLRRDGLYPLPQHPYTRKYQWFCRLANSRVGLALLRLIIPLTKKEP